LLTELWCQWKCLHSHLLCSVYKLHVSAAAIYSHTLCCVGESDSWRGSWIHWKLAEHRWLWGCSQVGSRQSQHVPDELVVQDAQGVVAVFCYSDTSHPAVVVVECCCGCTVYLTVLDSTLLLMCNAIHSRAKLFCCPTLCSKKTLLRLRWRLELELSVCNNFWYTYYWLLITLFSHLTYFVYLLYLGKLSRTKYL